MLSFDVCDNITRVMLILETQIQICFAIMVTVRYMFNSLALPILSCAHSHIYQDIILVQLSLAAYQ